MKYSTKFFKDNLPEWKRKKDSTFGRLLYRPISFVLASVSANLGISANTVSYFSALVAITAGAMFLFRPQICHIIGAILMIIWVILDCVDGNLARCVKKQPFGEFADSISSYFLVGFTGATMGIAVYFEGGLLFKAGDPWIILIGALASSADTMMRLVYQKYTNTARKLADQGIIERETEFRVDGEQKNTLMTVIDREFGLGIIPEIVLLTAVFKALDLAVIYCFLYYGGSFVLSTLVYVRKAIKTSKEYEVKQ